MGSERELTGGEAITALGDWFDRRMREINGVAEGEIFVNTMTGKVKRVLADKGFGFITDEKGVDRFFHKDQTLANFTALSEGDAVRFTPIENPKKGPRAENVDLA